MELTIAVIVSRGRRCFAARKMWSAIASTLRGNVDVAVTLYRNDPGPADRRPPFGER
jgi:hypothetical protein